MDYKSLTIVHLPLNICLVYKDLNRSYLMV